MRIYKKILSNNLQTIFIPDSKRDTVAMGFFVATGARNEFDESQNGISHFLEHMMFKGTTNRDLNKLLSDIDKYTINYNAVTTFQHTYYYLQGLKIYTKQMMDILFDIFLNTLITTSDTNSERKVIMEESHLRNDSPFSKLYQEIHKKIFAGTTLANKIIGTENSLSNIKAKDIIDYKNKYYVPENMIFIMTGNFNYKLIFPSVIRSLSKLENVNMNELKLYNKNMKQNEIDIITKNMELQDKPYIYKKKNKYLNQVYVMLCFPLYDLYDKYNYEIQVISNLLTSGLSSRLNFSLRENNGITYNSQAYPIVYTKTSIFVIQFALNPKYLDRGIKIILKQLRSLKKELISDEELKKIKNMIISSAKTERTDPIDNLINYGINYLYDRDYKSDNGNFIKNIKNIRRNTVNKVACDFFLINKLNVFIYGNYDTIDDKLFEKI